MGRTDIIPGTDIPEGLVGTLYPADSPANKLSKQLAEGKIIYVIEVRGGDDKNEFGHRPEVIPTANKIIEAGMNAVPLFYSWGNDESFRTTVLDPKVVGVVCITGAVLPSFSKDQLDKVIDDLKSAGKLVAEGTDIYSAGVPKRFNTLMEQPGTYKYKCAVIQFKVPGAPNGAGSTDYVVGEFNCSCVGISKFQAVCGGDKSLADVPDEDYYDASKLTDLMGTTALKFLRAKNDPRQNTLMPSPPDAKHKCAVIQFKVPGAPNGGSDKGADGNRVDSIPIANGIIKAGGACDLLLYDYQKHDEFVASVQDYDALLVRINPGQLSQGTGEGVQERFDNTMNDLLAKGKLVWSSPSVQTQMGAKDALVKIKDMSCGLPDTFAYYEAEELEEGFKKSMAFQPRVIKQNRGSAGEGIWLCWLEGKDYCANFGDAVLADDDKLKVMEMNDNHVEYHTVKEFLTFCVDGPTGEGAGEWKSTFPGKYLEGGKAAGGQLVDQRLCPRISEGEVRMLMVGDVLQMMIHKKPEGGGLSAVGGNSAYTYYKPGSPEYAKLEDDFVNRDIPQLMKALEIENDPLPILWTGDFIPVDGKEPGSTDYVVGEFNCSCVGISKFQAVCGGDKTLADVPDEDYYDASELTDLMGKTAIKFIEAKKAA
eukprot:CAMPEP_0185564140 /NCGR_PEP_ID=MMETSP1381-20130426/64954_1 /TAXON_ID=298111 /ORGANISM="Pavlova sp., Strain CCMP459" /LENGTH=649 /DNA_ID=CAMNT_0028178071 /DNA_START=85 /DNA_END=2035 /DNA_ORIENTATION=-